MWASFRSTRSQVPRCVEREGTDENAKITPAQTTTGSQRETIRLYSRAITGAGWGTRVQIQDGPAAVRGDALRQTPLSTTLGKAAEGEPRVRRPAGRPPYRSPRGRRN